MRLLWLLNTLEGIAVIHGVRPWLQSSANLCECFKRKLSSIQREFTNFYSANIASSEKTNQVMNADFPTSAVPFPHLQVAYTFNESTGCERVTVEFTRKQLSANK
jgi:hypothetical protein